jgi:hypothetical protein
MRQRLNNIPPWVYRSHVPRNGKKEEKKGLVLKAEKDRENGIGESRNK